MTILEFRAFNLPFIIFKIDAADVHLLAKSKRWNAFKPRKALSFYIRGSGFYLHRLIANAPQGMTVNHKDGDALNNVRSNLEVVTQSENARHGRVVLRRGGCFSFPNATHEHKVRKRLANGTIRVYVYERRTKTLLRSWDEPRTDS